MEDARDRPVWFSEPSQADDSWGRRGESLTSWVERATLSRARATRRFLNENLSMLPKEHQLPSTGHYTTDGRVRSSN
jgi:hypothetical protein